MSCSVARQIEHEDLRGLAFAQYQGGGLGERDRVARLQRNFIRLDGAPRDLHIESARGLYVELRSLVAVEEARVDARVLMNEQRAVGAIRFSS